MLSQVQQFDSVGRVWKVDVLSHCPPVLVQVVTNVDADVISLQSYVTVCCEGSVQQLAAVAGEAVVLFHGGSKFL